MELPDECWELIFKSLDHHRHLEPLSMVCHNFLSITDLLRLTLTIIEPTLSSLPQLLRRFQNLKKIRFPDTLNDLDSVLHLVSRSGLQHLESLDVSKQGSLPVKGLRCLGTKIRNLKELYCAKLCSLRDSDLIEIGNSFPFLEVLDISYPEHDGSVSSDFLDSKSFSGVVTDNGILALASMLKRLRKINLSGNQLITDQSFVALSLNCVWLTEIAIRDCDFITQKGIGLAMRNCANLKAISVIGIGIPSIDSIFKDSFAYARALFELDLSNSFLSDELLCLIAEACLPLKTLILSHCYCMTCAGISCLLSKCQSLLYLDLEGANFLTDESMFELAKFLGNITFINLSSCSKLTDSTFFNLARSCPFLSIIYMERTNFGVEEFTTQNLVNSQIKSLFLAGNNSLNDECIKRIASVCPNLEVLDVSGCSGITEQGIVEILKSCCQIRCLKINGCHEVNSLEIDFQLPKLEVLQAQRLDIDDEVMAMIGKRCSSLLYLDLQCCLNVTERGVKEVVVNCRALKEINLRWCKNVSIDSVAWMVFSRPSLRKIIPPPAFDPTKSQRKFFLRHGCLVCKG